MLDSLPTQMGLMNALRTGNMVLDMCVCMLLPLFFGGIGSVVRELLPMGRRFFCWVRTRNEVTRTISYERRVNFYGWTVGAVTHDHYLQKALMMWIAKHTAERRGKRGNLTLTELPKREQDRRRKEAGDADPSNRADDGYDSCDDDDDDDRYGPAATLRTLEVTTMPPDGEWIEVRMDTPPLGGAPGDVVRVLRTSASESDGGDKMPMKTERTTLELRAEGRRGEAHIRALVDAAYAWYRQTLEAERDEKRYMFVMLRGRPGGDDGGGGDGGAPRRLYKRYALSAEKTFASLFFPERQVSSPVLRAPA